jgi:hypothetical protein
MSIPSSLRCATLAAIISTLSFVTPASVRAQGYPDADCSDPYYYQYCQYYYALYGYSNPYYLYGFPVGAGIGFGFFHHRPVFHRHPPSFHPGLPPGMRGGGLNRR